LQRRLELASPGSMVNRRLWRVLYGWTAAWGLLTAWGGGYSWHYLAQGAHLLTHPGPAGAGLHLYASHPDLQIGPLALLLAVPFEALGPTWGKLLAEAVLTFLGPVLLHVLSAARQSLTGRRPPPALLLCTGLLVLPVWCQVATHFTHLDDALAIAFTCVAALAVAQGRPFGAALALAAAADSKPWALGFTVLLLALPTSQRWRSLAVASLGAAFGWLPFVLADPRTLDLGRFSIHNVDNSALRALGAHGASTPAWDRPAQLALGVMVALICVRRGHWAAAPLAVVAARLLLDPQTYSYYSSGLLMCAALLDMLSPKRRMPVWTAVAAAWFLTDYVGGVVLQAEQRGSLRAMFCVGLLLALCLRGQTGSSPRLRRSPPGGSLLSAPSAGLVRLDRQQSAGEDLQPRTACRGVATRIGPPHPASQPIMTPQGARTIVHWTQRRRPN